MPTFALSQLQQNVLDELDGNVGEFPLENIRLALNQILARLNIMLGWNMATVPIPTQTLPSNMIYPVPSGILIPMRCEIEGQEVDPISLRRLSREFPYWFLDSTASSGPISRWSRLGLTQFILHPQDSVGGQLCEITGISPITQLVNPGDVISLDQQWADVLVQYAAIRVQFKETGTAWQNASKGLPELKRKIARESIWRDMAYPGSWLDKQLSPADARAT